MKTYAAGLTLAVLAVAGVAQAQPPQSGCIPPAATGYGVPQHHYGFGGPVAGRVHHASTAYESFLRGQAAVIQAQGQRNLLTSLALMNLAQAQRMQWDNQQAFNQARTMKAEAYRQQQAEKRTANRQAIQERTASKRASHRRDLQLASSR